jgi:hypothetical protein
MPTLKQMRKLLSSPEFCKPCKREELKKNPKAEQKQIVEHINFERISYKYDGVRIDCKYHFAIAVGSDSCQLCCYNKLINHEDKWIFCSYLRDKALEKTP